MSAWNNTINGKQRPIRKTQIPLSSSKARATLDFFSAAMHQNHVKPINSRHSNSTYSICEKIMAMDFNKIGLIEFNNEIENMMKSGCNINEKNCFGETPLYYVVTYGNRLEYAKNLIKKGANVDPSSNLLEGPIQSKNKELVEFLLKTQADPNFILNDEDVTLLHFAVGQFLNSKSYEEDKSFAIIKLLLEHGANINAKDMNDNTPLQWMPKNHPRFQDLQHLFKKYT